MIPQLADQLRTKTGEIREIAEWIDEDAAPEGDVNHPLHCARRAVWAAHRLLVTAAMELDKDEGGK